MALVVPLEMVRAEEGDDPHAIRRGPQEYHLRWPEGEVDVVEIRWDEALLAELAALREATAEVVARIGERLRRLLAPTRWRLWEERILAAAGAGEPVFVEFRAAAAELYALPWELLTLTGSGRHLGELPGVHVRQRWPGTQATAPASRRETGRVVVACSRSHGPIGESHFVAAIAAAAGRGEFEFDPERDVLMDMSFEALQRALTRRCEEDAGVPVVLHVLCHGAAIAGGYGLGWGDGSGGRDVVDAPRIRQLAPLSRWIRLVVLTVCDGASVGAPGSLLGSVAQALHRAGFESVVASRAPLAGAAALACTEAFYGELLETPGSVESAVCAARARLRARSNAPDWASLCLLAHHEGAQTARPVVFRPYRGLLSFQSAHARFFFGRESERDEAVADLAALIAAGKPRLLVVAGASGTGKSSVVLAGVLPALGARGFQAGVLRPGRDPLAALAAALAPLRGRSVVVVDQFEEVFTHEVAAAAAQAFARRLWQLARDDSREVAVILTLRVDYLGRCGDLVLDDAGTRLDRVAYDEAHRVFVPQIAREKLRRTIEGPAEKVGLTLEEGLTERLLEQVGDEPGALPLLQYALDELWRSREGDRLTHAGLAAIGGAVGAMTRRAEAIRERMSPAERLAARRLLVRMVSYGESIETGVRRQVLEDSLRPAEVGARAAFDGAVAKLVDARLLVRTRLADGTAALDVTHEALLRRFEPLWQWYQEDRARLAEQAQLVAWAEEWRRFPDNLLTGNRLGFASRLCELYGDELPAAARELVAASEEAARKRAAEVEASRRRRRTATVVIGAVLVAGMIVTGALALGLRDAEGRVRAQLEVVEEARRIADENEAAMRRSLQISEVRRLTMAAREQESHSPRVALHLAAAAAAAERGLGGEMLLAPVASELRRLLAHAPEQQILPHSPPAYRLAFFSDGATLATGDGNGSGTVRLWSLVSGQPIAELKTGWVTMALVEPSRDGRRLMAFEQSGEALVWSAPWTAAPRRFVYRASEGQTYEVPQDARLAPTGTALAIRNAESGEIRVWRIDAGEGPLVLTSGPGPVPPDSLQWSDDGERLLAASAGEVRVWTMADLRRPVTLAAGEEIARVRLRGDGRAVAVGVAAETRIEEIAGPAQTLARCEVRAEGLWFSPGQELVVATADGELVGCRVGGGRVRGPSGTIRDLSFGTSTIRAVTTTADGRLVPWTVADPDAAVLLAAEVRPREPVVFDPAGTRVAAVGEQGSVHVFDLESGFEPRVISGGEYAQWITADAFVVGLPEKWAIARCEVAGGCSALAEKFYMHGRMTRFSPDGRFVFSPQEGVARVPEPGEAAPTRTAWVGDSPVLEAVWSGDSRRLVVLDTDGVLAVLDAATMTRREVARLTSPARSLVVSPDGEAALVLDETSVVTRYPLAAPGEPQVIRRFGNSPWQIAYGPRGTLIIVPHHDDGPVLLLRPGSDSPRAISSRAHRAALDASEGHLYTAVEGGRIQRWQLDAPGEPIEFAGPVCVYLSGLVVSPTADVLALTCGSEVADELTGAVWLVRADGAGEPAPLLGAGANPLPVFSPDGGRIATFTYGGVKIWRVRTADLVARACDLAGVALTPLERSEFGVGEGLQFCPDAPVWGGGGDRDPITGLRMIR